MKIWFDTEFIEDGRTIDLLSIGMVAEDGRELYLQNADADLSKASEWVKDNVFPYMSDLEPVPLGIREHLPVPEYVWMRTGGRVWRQRKVIRAAIVEFIGDNRPEFWGSCSAYDHVALCQLFGRMIDLPLGWPFYTNDIQQWAMQLGLPRDWDSKVPTVGTAHNALADARWTRDAYIYLLSGAKG